MSASPWYRPSSEVGLIPAGVVHVLQNSPDDPLQLFPGSLLLFQRPPHALVVLREETGMKARRRIPMPSVREEAPRLGVAVAGEPHLFELLHLVFQAVDGVHQAPAGTEGGSYRLSAQPPENQPQNLPRASHGWSSSRYDLMLLLLQAKLTLQS